MTQCPLVREVFLVDESVCLQQSPSAGRIPRGMYEIVGSQGKLLPDQTEYLKALWGEHRHRHRLSFSLCTRSMGQLGASSNKVGA